MRFKNAILVAGLLASIHGRPALAATTPISWNPTVLNADGTPMTDLAGYRVFQATKSLLPLTTTQAMADATVTKITVTGSTTTTLNLAAGATYFIRLAGYDTSGNQSGFNVNAQTLQNVELSTYIAGSTPADTTPPTVSIKAPLAGATVSGAAVAVSGTAADNVGVVGVQFKLDGANLGLEDTTAPYAITWNSTLAANGAHTLTAVARDAAGNTATSAAIAVTVNNAPPPDTTAPTVSITAPAAGATVSGPSVAVTGTASDNVGVASVQFKLDGVNLGALLTAAPYTIAWNTTLATNGAHTLTAVAKDAAGNTTTSSAIPVTVNNAPPPDTTAPTVSITAPAAGAAVSGPSVAVSGTAADNVGVVGVQFKLDGTNLGAEDTAAPYSVAWNTTLAANGAHTLTAVARDAAGNTATSAARGVTVNNVIIPPPDTTPPTVSIKAPLSGATVSGASLKISGTAADNVGVASVQFMLDGANLGATLSAVPYFTTWDTTLSVDGPHALTAVAKDAAGNTTTSAIISVTVANSVAPSTFTYIRLAWDPITPTLAIVSLNSTDPAFPATLTLQTQMLFPSGLKNLTLTQSPTAPADYFVKIPTSTFAFSEYFLSGATIPVTIGAQSFPAILLGGGIQKDLGGLVREPSGITQVVVMPGGVTADAQLTILPPPPDPGIRAAALTRQNLLLLGPGRDIIMNSTGTLNAAALTLSFDPTLIPKGRSISDVRLGYFNPNTRSWEVIGNLAITTPPGSPNGSGSAMTVPVTHFSLYAPILLMPTSEPGLRDSYAFPNPAKGSQDPTIRSMLGLVDNVEITIFDTAGRLVHSVSLPSTPTGIINNQYYYDYTWVGPKSSGIYFAVVHGKSQADGSIVKARVHFAVVK